MISPLAVLRSALRLGIYPGLAAICFADYGLERSRHDLRAKAEWLRRVALRHSKWVGLRIRVCGTVPSSGLIVSNHLSYLDIVGLSAALPCTFVSKQEVGGWPVFGTYARLGGTIFVNREQRGAVAGVVEQMKDHLAASVPIVLFPEGTSTGGDSVLPFRSSLLDPAVKLGCPITPCGLHYVLDDGCVADEIAYWRDMSLVPHLANLLGKGGFTLEIRFGAPRLPATDRKTLARTLQAEVAALAQIPAGTSRPS